MPISKINTSSITDNSVTAGKIVAGAVDADIAAGSIDTAQMADDAVTADKLANAINTTIAAKAPIASPSFTAKATISIASANGDILDFRSNGSDVGTIGTLGGATYFGSEDSGIMFNGVNQNPTSGGSTRVDNTNDLGAASYRYKNIYLGGGAFIGGTATANKLDDYEEGTWSMVIKGSTGSTGSWAQAGVQASYTKIGRVVHFTGTGYVSNKGSYSGGLQVQGLPFASGNTNGNTAVSASSIPVAAFGNAVYIPQVQANSSACQIRKGTYLDATAQWSELVVNIRLNISGFYTTA